MKRLSFAKRPDALVPDNDIGVLLDLGKLKAHYDSMTDTKQKNRFIAFLHSIYSARQLESMIGVKIQHVQYCSRINADVLESAQVARCLAIGNLCGQRAIEILQKTNVEKIQDRYKPKAVKDLMDAMDIAGLNAAPQQQRDDGDTLELVMRVKRKMKPRQNEDDKEREEKDVTSEVEIEKTKLLEGKL